MKKSKNIGFIYKIYFRNSTNNKVYIGQSSLSLRDVKYRHKRRAFDEKDERFNTKIYQAIRKYGIKNTIFKIIEKKVDFYSLNEREIFYIKQFNSHQCGYNSTSGGDYRDTMRFRTMSLSSREKTSKALLGRTGWSKGKKLLPRSENTKRKISIANSGSKNGMFGKFGGLSATSKSCVLTLSNQEQKIFDCIKDFKNYILAYNKEHNLSGPYRIGYKKLILTGKNKGLTLEKK